MTLTAAEHRRLDDLYQRGQYLTIYEQVKPLGSLDTWQGPDALVLAGKLAVNLGAPRFGQAIHRRAWRRHPQHAELWYYVSWLELRQRGPLAALRHAERFKLPGNAPPEVRAEWLAQRAHFCAVLRDFEEADKAMEQAIALEPDRPWIRVEQASILDLEDRHEEALETSQRALDLQPFYRPAVQQAAQVLVQLNRDDEAMDLLRAAAETLQSGAVVAQLASLEIELRRYEQARARLDDLERFFPLLDRDKHMAEWLAARRGDAAYFCGDYAQALELLRKVDQPFFKSVAARLQENGDDGQRVELDVGFVRQHYATCAPATLSAVCRYWGRPFDHLEVAESICYDGTPDHNERNWVEAHGFYAREFRVTWESARALIDAGIPFTLTTVGPGAAHLQAVFGYDSRRGVLLVRDPSERHFAECLAEEMIKHQSATGPRGMAFVPKQDRGRLDGIDLPEAEFYDDYYRLQRALEVHDRDAAEQCYRRLAARDTDHRLAIHGRARLAAYDADQVALARCIDKLLEMYPDDVNQQMARLRLLRESGTRRQRLDMLREICGRSEFDPMFQRLYAEELLDDGRALEEAAYAARRAMRARPLDAENFRLMANICWARRDRQEALRLLRFAACLQDRNEVLSMAYFSASRYLNRTGEATRFLKDRFERFGTQKGWPAESLCEAFEQLDQQEDALKVLEEALKRRPDDGDLMLVAARYYSRFNRDERARELLGQAKGRSHPLAWLQAMAYRALYRNDLPEALRFGREVLEADPFNGNMNGAVAWVLHNLHGPEAAEAHLRELVERFPYHYGLRMQLLEHLTDDDPARREAEVREFLRLHPDDPWARRELASVLAHQQRLDEALEEVRAAIASEDTNPAGHFFCGQVHERRNEPELARECYCRAIELSVDYEPAMHALVELCRSKAEREAALELIYGQLVEQVTFGEGLLTFREVARGTLQPERLLEILREALDMRPDLWQAWSAVVQQLIAMERGEEAVATAETARDKFAMLPRMSLDLASAHHAAGDSAREITATENALMLAPTWGEALRQLSDAHRAAGDFEASKSVLEKAIAYEPRNVVHQGELADVLWTQGRREEAIAGMKEAVQREPRYEWGWRRLRDWSQVVREPELIAELGRQIVAQRPKSAGCWMLLAEILEEFPQHYEECLRAVDRVLELEPRHEEAHGLRADLLASVGQFEEASAACRPAAFAGMRPTFLRVKEAEIESRRGDLDTAITQLKSVVADDPDYALGWARLADWYDTLGKDDEYIDASRNLVRIAPRHAAARGYLADGLLRNGNRDEAKKHLQRAIALDSSYAFAAVRLFDLHMEDREHDQAMAVVETAGHEFPDDYRLACEVRALAAKRERDAAKQRLALLCRCKMDDAEWLQRAVEAMWKALPGWQVGEVLSEALEDAQASPHVAGVWLRHAARAGQYRLIQKKLRALADRSDRWHILAQAHAAHLAEDGQDPRLDRFVRKYRSRLRADTASWAAVGAAYRDLSRNRKVIRWMRDWPAREDATPLMLFPLVLAHLAVGSTHKATEVAAHALSLTRDRSFDYHLLWLAAIGLLHGDCEGSVACFSRINPGGYTEYYQQLYGLVGETLGLLRRGPGEITWPEARQRLKAARGECEPATWADKVVKRLYWRCYELAARHTGSTMSVTCAKLRRMAC
jgi:tetratricopeptide (TPR) repeat protein